MERISDEQLKEIATDGIYTAIEHKLATALLEERKQPKVWADAPEWATRASVLYKDVYGDNRQWGLEVSRDLHKSPIREIAEKAANDIDTDPVVVRAVANRIESAIAEAMALKA